MFIHLGNEVTRTTDRSFGTLSLVPLRGMGTRTTFTSVDRRAGPVGVCFPTLRKKREGWGTRSFAAGKKISMNGRRKNLPFIQALSEAPAKRDYELIMTRTTQVTHLADLDLAWF
jgi:hypothetical protein